MFKVGDRVNVSGFSSNWDGPGKVINVSPEYICVDFGRVGGYDRGGFERKYIKPAQEGPVRSVTRREIVPGAYGQVSVISADRGRVEIFIDATSTADQLREAAHLFNQLAEALDDKP